MTIADRFMFVRRAALRFIGRRRWAGLIGGRRILVVCFVFSRRTKSTGRWLKDGMGRSPQPCPQRDGRKYY
jgi:hypothetical protein